VFGHRALRRRHGGVRLTLSAAERDLLAGLARELDARLAGDADAGADDLRRLFPPAYAERPEDEAEYRRLVHDELLDGRRKALGVFTASLDGETLTEEELVAWLSTLNDLRLVLGTRLDVQEETLLHGVDPHDPRARELAVYGYLSWLQEQAVEAASAGLDG
jgi:hypothetical protein